MGTANAPECPETIRRRVVALFAGTEANVDRWLRTPNQYLHRRIPVDMIHAGKKSIAAPLKC